jgi:hypothetical protein
MLNVIGIAVKNIRTNDSGMRLYPVRKIGITQKITKLNGPIKNPSSNH